MISPIGNKRPLRNKGITPFYTGYSTGFTLIELVLVVVIISIIVGLSSPLFRKTFSDLQLRNTSFNLAKLVNYSQEMAIVERRNYKISFDVEKGRFWVMRHEMTGDTYAYKRISGRYGKIFRLPEGLVFAIQERETGESGEHEIVLYPDGRSGKMDIAILDVKGMEGRILKVKGFGGRVTIEPFKDES